MSAASLSGLGPAQRAAVTRLFGGLRTTFAIRNFVRVLASVHATSPLGFSFAPSRFSPLPANLARFGVLYLAGDLATGVYETVVRDRFDMNPARVLYPADYSSRVAVNVSTRPEATLDLLDLTGGNAARHGVPTDVIKGTAHADGQHLAEFVHSELPTVDGFLYRSRLTEGRCVAVYGRAVARLDATTPRALARPML